MTRVLVVDDSAVARHRAAEPLEEAGYEVVEAADEAEAQRVVRTDPPDAVIVSLGSADRAEPVLRQAGARSSIAVVGTLASEDEEAARRLLAAGADDVLVKDPTYGTRVVNAVRRCLVLAGGTPVEIGEDDPGRVLVLDDSPVVRRFVRRILAEAEVPLSVVGAEDAEQALELVREDGFDALLVDHVLPDTTGASFLERLRSEGLRTPALALTGQRDPDLAERFLEAGAHGMWTKEHEGPRRLRATVEQLVRMNRADPGPPDPPPAGPR